MLLQVAQAARNSDILPAGRDLAYSKGSVNIVSACSCTDEDELHSLDEHAFESCDEDLMHNADVASLHPLCEAQPARETLASELASSRGREQRLADCLRRSEVELQELRKQAEDLGAAYAELQAEAQTMRNLLAVRLPLYCL